MWFNGRLSYRAVELKKNPKKQDGPSVSVSFPASFNIRSLAVSLGSERIDLNSYRERLKSSWEITFSQLKWFKMGVSQLAFCRRKNI